MGHSYLWAKGSSQKLSAQLVGNEMERIRINNAGIITVENVVEKATDAASPLHGGFEWNDEVASFQYRLIQARQMIRDVRQ